MKSPAAVQVTHNAECLTQEFGHSRAQETTNLDSRTIACVRNLVHAIVRAPHLQQDREDYLQEALLRFWEALRKSPWKSPASHLTYCRFFVRDSLKHGRSLDSPKRRPFGCSFQASQNLNSLLSLAAKVVDTDPLQEICAQDDFIQISIRLTMMDRSILKLLLEGNTVRQVARRLSMSPSSVGKSKLRIKSVAIQIGLRPFIKIRGKSILKK